MLVEKFLKLAYWKAHRWAERVHNDNLLDEFISCCEIGLINAAHTYDFSSKNKFRTYATACMDNQVKLYLRKNLNQAIPFSTLETHNKDPDDEIEIERIIDLSEQMEDVPEQIYIDKLLHRLPDKEYNILYMYFFLGYNEYEIAKTLNYSQSYVSRLKKQAIEKLKRITGIINRETNSDYNN